jgi:hypothetical protein
MLDKYKKVDRLEKLLDILRASPNEVLLNQLYLRVFNTPDGELVLQDLADRCHINAPCMSDKDEGARLVWVSIQTRLYNAINPKKESEENDE